MGSSTRFPRTSRGPEHYDLPVAAERAPDTLLVVLFQATSGHASRKALSTLVGLLGRGLVSGGDVAEMFSLYRAAFSLQAIVAGQQYGFEAFGRSEDVPEDWMAAHRALSDRDPAPGWLMSAPVGSVYRAGTLGSHKLDIGREFYRFGWRDCAVTMMPTPFGGPFWMGLYRRVGAKKFSDHEATLVSLLHPHLSAALTTRSALAAIEADRAETFDHALSRFEGHAFVSLPRLSVSFRGEPARSSASFSGTPRLARSGGTSSAWSRTRSLTTREIPPPGARAGSGAAWWQSSPTFRPRRMSDIASSCSSCATSNLRQSARLRRSSACSGRVSARWRCAQRAESP